MANRKLSTLPLDEEVKATLAMMSLETIKDVVTLPPYTLMDVLGQSAAQYNDFMDTLLSVCLPPRTTAYEMEERERRNTIPLGNRDLDILLGGGILPGSLYEFVGPPGVGKTQWCLHMSASVVAAGRGEGETSPSVIYIDTECAARPERLVQIMKNKYPELSAEISKLLSRIHVFRPQTTAELLEILDSLEFTAIEKDARLVVVDSITSIEDSLSTTSRRKRAAQLSSWAAKLKGLAHNLNICVVVTNQTTTMSDPYLHDPDLIEDYEGPEQAVSDPESPAAEAMDDMPLPMDPVPDPESPAAEARDDMPVPMDPVPDPESPAAEARDDMPVPMDPVPDPEDPMPDLENRVPDQGYVTDPEDHLVDSTTGPENSVPDQGHVSDPEICIPDSTTGPENRVPDQGHVSDLEICIPESTTGPGNGVPDQGHVSDPEDHVQELLAAPENRMPYRGHVSDPEDPMPENRVPYQGHVSDPEDPMPENRVPYQGHVSDPDDPVIGPEESVDSAEPSSAHTPLSENSVPDQDHVSAPEDPMSMSDQEESDDPDKASKPLIPAMGDTWTNCVNTRIVLQYTDSGGRQLVIAKSPVSPYAVLTYYIREDGIVVDERNGVYTYNSGVDPSRFRMRPCPEEVAFGSLSKQ
ncbi:DNA repair protein RAD51 homolog 2-like isoform X2 [Eriocheir sinensis]|uniref:DNA repair protein RAD51 homolog 2-like isoform X2 n=1 Tax=Eriocheir sinensis TaxID=95602 RepID=UPI0021C5C2E4|nr:DNA repair protein RAD51 homolog 2-like isoform X2 [Eriocheir sinensis]